MNAAANVCGLGALLTGSVGLLLLLLPADVTHERAGWVGAGIALATSFLYFAGYLVGRADERRTAKATNR
jgi:hypothetical protein